jgi:sirohydrochlorin cobaltochelatase
MPELQMRNDLTSALERWIQDGARTIGQVRIIPRKQGFVLRHCDDSEEAMLTEAKGLAEIRTVVRNDEDGNFRPLKSAPNLRRGWFVRVRDVTELHQVIDYFYPAAIGLLFSHRHGQLEPVHFCETTVRQTGMYSVTRSITDDEADEMIGRFCRSRGGCLRTILWRLRPGRPIHSLPAEKFDPVAEEGLPILCAEACNLLVAEARRVVKRRKP